MQAQREWSWHELNTGNNSDTDKKKLQPNTGNNNKTTSNYTSTLYIWAQRWRKQIPMPFERINAVEIREVNPEFGWNETAKSFWENKKQHKLTSTMAMRKNFYYVDMANKLNWIKFRCMSFSPTLHFLWKSKMSLYHSTIWTLLCARHYDVQSCKWKEWFLRSPGANDKCFFHVQ